jgi:hypothetical protein
MKEFRQPTLEERRIMAAKAKQAQLEAARAKAPANDPKFAERLEARRKVSEDRESRARDRKVQRVAEAKRKEAAQAEEALAKARALEAAKQAREAEAAQAAARKAASEIENKAKRDARYAARKARKK